MAPNQPETIPAQVLFGEILAKNFGPPIKRPPK